MLLCDLSPGNSPFFVSHDGLDFIFHAGDLGFQLFLHALELHNLYIHLYGDGFDEMYQALVGNG